MENCLAAAVLNGVDRRSLQRSARLGQEVLERAKKRAVNWHSLQLPKGTMRVLTSEGTDQERRLVADPQRLLPGEREERCPTLNASFRTMAEFMDYASSQCGKYYASMPEEGGANHVYRYHRGKSESSSCSDLRNGQRQNTALGLESICQGSQCDLQASQPAEDIAKDLYIEVYPGTYSVTVGSNDLTKKTLVVAVDSGQSVDLVFPI
ncbi:PREDICTED: A-kinase-interacting protein 1 isoform X1 [Elephantulus edwardii]|uniref:A-kinase-interacting protein 1 isoform X1 n=1 Tax=Elephantulus edwardii TaxID=28737 RepID=UPI0003F0C798|nr:PREDICTED: A-kinase-interacting protein 1 isoform X1 [Elephantulus edwardii]